MLKKLSQTLVLSFAFTVLTAQADSPDPVETPSLAGIPTQIEASKAITATTAKSVPAAASTAVQSPLEKPDGWQLFKPPAQDFQILLPANVQRRADNKPGKSSFMYYQHADDIDFLIADGSYISSARRAEAQQGFYEEAVNTIAQQLNKKTPSLVTKEVSPVDGKGWHGKQISFRSGGKDLATVRVVFSTGDDVAYKLLASSGADNEKVKTFFDSFEVDPAIASKAHLDSASSASVRNFMGVIWPISLIVLVLAFFTLVASAFRNRKS